MNVFDEIQGSRPDVTPMPLTERRMIRESLFGLGHGDTTRTISGRSENGAVVSTAPHGMRRPARERPGPAGSLVKLGAGLIVLAGLGVAIWSYSNDEDGVVESVESTSSTTSTSTTTSTAAPATLPPLVRTAVTAEMPLALPPTELLVELLIEEAVVTPAVLGSSSSVLGDPEGSEVWIGEFDGEPSDTSGLEIRQVGGIGVGVERGRDAAAPASYRPVVPCGVVIVNDAPGRALDRQPMIDLFEAMSIDADATIDISLPAGWSVLSIGDSRPAYTVEFRVPAAGAGPPDTTDAVTDATGTIRLTQVPEGSFAQLMFGGRQLDPIDFLGAPGFVDVGTVDPAFVSVFWQDATTVFNVSSTAVDVAAIEAFVESLEPVGIEDWNTRFASIATSPPEESTAPEGPNDAIACDPQPSFGVTFDP